ncbi:MAG: hypothetical protein K5Q68_08405 [Roseococcus sp.]|nr:hypothetical protein [Roseococcus sp.]
MTEALPHSLIGLLGPPRSGTTLIAHAMMAHPEATGLIEPYQVRREGGYAQTDPAALLRDFRLDLTDTAHVFVKETTTREANVIHLLELLRIAQAQGIYTGLVLILRCPFSAYLSQVEASRTLWKNKLFTEISPETFGSFAHQMRMRLRLICDQARAQHFRIVSYEAFCARSEIELARLMALVPLRLDARQLRFTPPEKISGGGDPKTLTKAGGIAMESREAEADAVRERFAGHPGTPFFTALQTLVRERVGHAPDGDVLDELTRLVLLAKRG